MKRDPSQTARAIIGLIAPANGGGGRGMMRGKSEPPSEPPSGETDLGSEAVMAAAEELLSAIKKNDKQAVADALMSAYMACDSMESEED